MREFSTGFWLHRRSVVIRLSVLAVVFCAAPIIIFGQFKAADETKNRLLQRSLEQQGLLIAEALKPTLEEFESGDQERPQQAVSRFASGRPEGERINVKLLFRPRGTSDTEGFFYVGSAPEVSSGYLQTERQNLIDAGIFGELVDTCEGTGQSFIRFVNPSGREEILTSLTPMHLANGCWVVITSNSATSLLQSSVGTAYWRAPDVQIAGAIYLLSAALICWLLLDIWWSLSRFRMAARRIRLRGPNGSSFSKLNRIPELAGVAEDFDSLVDRLTASQETIRKAAEENAHALKTPLAVIAQSVEPIKAALPASSTRARRSVEMIEQSVERLDALVTTARNLDQADADMIYPVKRRLNISDLLSRSLAPYRAALEFDGKTLAVDIEPGLTAFADEDLVETMLENLLENATSFANSNTAIEVSLKRRGKDVDLTVADRGPGVDDAALVHIFERYYSVRPAISGADRPASGNGHFGLGLWIVKRNAEGLGGAVRAYNRPGGGLAVTVTLKASL